MGASGSPGSMVGVGAGAHGVLGVPRVARKPANLRRASRNIKKAPGAGENCNERMLRSTVLSNAGRAIVGKDSVAAGKEKCAFTATRP